MLIKTISGSLGGGHNCTIGTSVSVLLSEHVYQATNLQPADVNIPFYMCTNSSHTHHKFKTMSEH